MHFPLRLRLTFWYAISLIILLAVFCGLIDSLMHRRLIARTDFELEEELHELMLEIRLASSREELLRQLALRFGEHQTYEFRIQTDTCERLFDSQRLREIPVPIPEGIHEKSIQFNSAPLADLGHSRIASQWVRTPQGLLVVQVIMPLGLLLSELADLRWLMAATGPLMAVFSIAGGYWLARTSLDPVDRMTEAASRITVQGLNERLDIENPYDELGRLATTFNGMLNRLEKSFGELRNFTADAAHEFRTPLAVMRSSLEVALRHPRSAAYYEDCLRGTAEEVERLTSLSNQLLLLAREDAGLSENPLAPLDLGRLVEGVVNDCEPLIDEKSLTVNSQLPSDIVILGTHLSLRRVFLNLLDNAIKASPIGGKIVLRLATHDSRARITISDAGSGIAPEHLPHLFERFYRVDPSRSRETGGTGLGLAICRAIVARHGGRIFATSDIGRGTTVSVELSLSIDSNNLFSQTALIPKSS